MLCAAMRARFSGQELRFPPRRWPSNAELGPIPTGRSGVTTTFSAFRTAERKAHWPVAGLALDRRAERLWIGLVRYQRDGANYEHAVSGKLLDVEADKVEGGL